MNPPLPAGYGPRVSRFETCLKSGQDNGLYVNNEEVVKFPTSFPQNVAMSLKFKS
ncbi:hypothetical protein DSCOOX_07310 [Desulfosarcina ovata subsp. ovata]|uniref:Uncharacterized protein n=1 Tax=Desulfosarcina ovata subsp. ovata TaxID=2752305 RepID=A0A5K8A4Y4_9BACT|nr:hypothetical protein DSCOOX_07310 [Desulfosarcina ovata subsp. ovata]